eukprot:GHVT01041447.1.p1 GENE.GHVT01041447.1~~GHVT01041447.1.p1  ORF type:complete len:339 (+),score=52.21 GHVT01041447.1:411-1427(+)
MTSDTAECAPPPTTGQRGKELLQNLIQTWGSSFDVAVRYEGQPTDNLQHAFHVVFSRVTASSPVPTATVDLHCIIENLSSALEAASNGDDDVWKAIVSALPCDPPIRFLLRFEDENLVIDALSTVGANLLKNLDHAVHRRLRDKELIRQCLPVKPTDFERTRLALSLSPTLDLANSSPASSAAPSVSGGNSSKACSSAQLSKNLPSGASAAGKRRLSPSILFYRQKFMNQNVPGEQSAVSLPMHEDTFYDEIPVDELLTLILEAADEEGDGVVSHKDLSDLLKASPLGLCWWDLLLLMTTAEESPNGDIPYKAFIAKAPQVIHALRIRRRAYHARSAT